MTDYLKDAIAMVGVEPDAVLSSRVYEDRVVFVVEQGMKYDIPVSDLDKPVVVESGDLGIYDMDYRQLQALARERGISARQSKDHLIAALAADEEE